MKQKLFDSEAKVMEIIWAKSPVSAKDISLIATETIGWNKNTTYTVIKKLEAKGFIKRNDPGFICTPLVSQNEMQKVEAASLVKKIFGGSRKALFSALIEDEPLSEEEIDELRKLIDKGDGYVAGNILLDIQYEHSDGYNGYSCHAHQAGKKDSKKVYGGSLDDTFCAYGGSLWIKQSIQSHVSVIQNQYKNR